MEFIGLLVSLYLFLGIIAVLKLIFEHDELPFLSCFVAMVVWPATFRAARNNKLLKVLGIKIS